MKPLSARHARPDLFPAETSLPAAKLDAVTRTIRNVPDYDGPRGAEKVQVELRRVPPLPEQPDPLAGVREAVHQASEPSSFVKTVKSVPDWDGPRGAEKIQVELRRSPADPEAALADHECPLTEEGELGAVPEERPVTNGDSNPQPFMRPGPGRCTKYLEFWLSGESHPTPCPQPVTCHNCGLPGHKVVQCPQLTMPGYPEPHMRPLYIYIAA